MNSHELSPTPAKHDATDRRDSSAVDFPIVHSQDIFRGLREVWIQHDGQTYRLRITRHGKLILTK